METLAEIYPRYAGQDCHSGSDKGTVHGYLETYERILAPYRHTAKGVLEIGILTGHSLRMWEDYFDTTNVYGVDYSLQPLGLADLRPMVAEGWHHIFILDATDQLAVQTVFGARQLDVVIEDASHDIEQQLRLYANFKPHLRPGAIYIIEDVADIDSTRHRFEQMDPSKTVEIIDLRHIKGRFDDVLVVLRDRQG